MDDPIKQVELIYDFVERPFTDQARQSIAKELGRNEKNKHGIHRYHIDDFGLNKVSLERIFEESRETYYEALERSSRGWHESEHDVFPWLEYFWGSLLRAYGEFEERVGEIQSSRGSKTKLIRDAVGRKMKPFSISDIERDCPGVSRDMVRNVLRKLREEGAISCTGRGRGSKWVRK